MMAFTEHASLFLWLCCLQFELVRIRVNWREFTDTGQHREIYN